MKRILWSAAAAALFALPAWAATQVVPAQSEIGFTIKQMGVPVQGRFKQFDAQVAFDPKAPQAAKIAFTIPVSSATMGVAEADAELPKPAWFDAAHQPRASFQSTAVKADGPNRYTVTGTLNIKGHSHPVSVPVTLTPTGSTTTAAGSFTIKRLDFGLGEGEWSDTSMVANEVTVDFKLALAGLPQ
jgi:polyisoprenoid-binding protein YceI